MMGCHPTGCRLAAPPPINWNDACLILTIKMPPILGPRSGVSHSGVLDGRLGMAFNRHITG
jgi:hypothetical protein